ncbi:hypothetical protein J6590_084832 [Homalodisca vitripennis]|nr:hypothetical protein J6590_084832 [Homalodisca vitripennis]
MRATLYRVYPKGKLVAGQEETRDLDYLKVDSIASSTAHSGENASKYLFKKLQICIAWPSTRVTLYKGYRKGKLVAGQEEVRKLNDV